MAGKTKKKLTVTQMRSVIKFLIGVNIVLLVAVIVLSVLLAVSRSKSSKDAVSIIKPDGKYTVCLDPGHGGSDIGATGINNIHEKDGNLKLSLKVAKLLKKNGVN